MNILFLTPTVPADSSLSDQFRPFRFIKALKQRGHSVTLLSFYQDDKELEKIKSLEFLCNEVIVSKRNVTYLNIGIKIFKFIVKSRIPFRYAVWFDKKFLAYLKGILSKNKFDVIYIFSSHLSIYTPYTNNSPIVIDIVDSKALFLTRSQQFEKNLLSLLYYTDRRHIQTYERELVNKFPIIITSESDAKYISSKWVPHIVPVYIKESFFQERGTFQKTTNQRIIFTGNYSYGPNRDAIEYFIDEIFPIVRGRLHEIEVLIVGKGLPKPIKRKLSTNPNIKLLGFVDNLERLIETCNVFIAPLRYGTGVKNKVIEAMALGLPVVATSIANEGIDATDGVELLIGDTPEIFAKKIIDLVENKQFADEIANRGRKFVFDNFHPTQVIDKLEIAIKSVAVLKR